MKWRNLVSGLTVESSVNLPYPYVRIPEPFTPYHKAVPPPLPVAPAVHQRSHEEEE